MDPRMRLQPGLVMQDHPSQVLARSGGMPGLSAYSLGLLQSQLGSERARQEYAQNRAQAQANANALRGAPGLVPSLSSGQGFYTVESLQGASAVPPRQDGFGLGHSHLVSQDAARSLAGGSFGGASQQGFGVGQQGFDAASLSYLLAHQAATHKLAASAPSAGTAPLSLLSHSLSEVNAGSGAARGAGNAASIYGYSTYSQPDVSLASARYAPGASLVPSEAALLLREQERLRERERDREKEREREREKEKERERERERDRARERAKERERERDRERRRERARRDDWARERRRDVERRREQERRQRVDKRRDLERKKDEERDGRAGDRPNHRSDTGSLSKRASRESPLAVRQSDRRDHAKSKDSRAREQKERKAWCSLCQVDCTTQEMLERHLEGKKHRLQLEAEEQKKKESSENAKANAEENVTDVAKEGKTITEQQVENKAATGSLKGKETNASKGKAKAKVSTRSKKSKSEKLESKGDASKSAGKDKALSKETIEVPEKVQVEVVEEVKLETEGTIEKVDFEVKELCSEGELKDVNVNPAPSNVDNFEEVKEANSEVRTVEEVEKVKEITINSKHGHNINSQVNETIQEVDINDESKKLIGDIDIIKVEQEAITSVVILEEKESGTEIVDEVINGNVEIKAPPNPDSQSGIAAQSEGNDSVLGKRSLEADGNPASAKKTRQLKSKSAGAAATVQPGTVRCEVCKVTCRNATVYESHLKGEKHAERLKKSQGQAPVSSTVKTTKVVEEAP